MASYVAFFRDLNLGQARTRSPTSDQLIDAFVSGGATGVVNFQSNGTVLFHAERPSPVIECCRAALHAVCGYDGAVMVWTGADVLAICRDLDPQLPGGEVALFDADRVPDFDLPWVEPVRGLLTVLAIDERHAVTCWSASRSGSNASAVLGRLLEVPVTSRSIGTMLRLGVRIAARDRP